MSHPPIMKILRTQQSPIAEFPHDILEMIFRIKVHEDTQNRDFFHDNDTTDQDLLEIVGVDGWRRFPSNQVAQARASSQVCRAWRLVILNSHLLWAQSLEIKHFPLPDINNPESTEWWKEAVRRAGQAPLWVNCANVGHMNDDGDVLAGPIDQSRIVHYLLPLLSSDIKRIERLELRLHLWNGLEKDERWGALREIGGATRELDLRVFPFPDICMGAPSLDIRRLLTPSLRAIQSLNIFARLNGLHIFESLKHLPQLRHLKINSYGVDDPPSRPVFVPAYPPLEVITLEKLESLELYNMLSDTLRLLPRIRTARACELVIKAPVVSDDPPPDDTELQEFKHALTTYYTESLAYASAHNLPTTELDLHAGPDIFRLSVEATSQSKSRRNSFAGDDLWHLKIDISPYWADEDLPEWICKSFMDVVYSVPAPALTKLALGWHFSPTHNFGNIQDSVPRFSQFLIGLTSLTVLIVWDDVLRCVLSLAEESMASDKVLTGLLPALQTLYLRFPDRNSRDYDSRIALLRRFMHWREVVGNLDPDILLDRSDFVDLAENVFRRGDTLRGSLSVASY